MEKKEIIEFKDMTRRQQVAAVALALALAATSIGSIVVAVSAAAAAAGSVVYGKLWKIEEGGGE